MTSKSFLVAALAILPTSVLAQSYDAAGVWTFTPTAVPYQVSDDLVLVNLAYTHDRFEPATADHPVVGATGECFGAIVYRSGQPSGTGNCHYVDASGDKLVTQWTVEGMEADGRTTGRWEFVGGTGRWSGSSGSGTYRSGQDASGAYTAELTGEMTLN